MIFDQAQIISAMGSQLTPAQRKQKGKVKSSLFLALDDLTMRLAQSSLLTSYEVAIAKGDRTVVLRGKASDLRYIFNLKFGSGENQGFLEWIDPEKFMKDFDNPAAGEGQPTRYTQLEAVDGFPKIKFDIPSSSASTLTVYYTSDLTADNINRARSSAVIVAGGLAYFHGVTSTLGMIQYRNFETLASLARASNDFKRPKSARFQVSKKDQQIMEAGRSIRNKRS